MDDLFRDFIIDLPSTGEKQWNILYEQIVKGNVIPVIGPDIIRIKNKTSQQFLIDALGRCCGIGDQQMTTFSQLLFDNRYINSAINKNGDIYSTLFNVIEKNPSYFDDAESNSLLLSILKIPYFKFVITTSFDPIVENMMRRVHGDKLRVLNFCNDPTNNEDLLNGEETRHPTLYYMFGKANMKENSFVVTEEDLLHFSQAWLHSSDCSNNKKPLVISKLLLNRYLLVLGHDYKDWLFRFFWFALKNEAFGNKKSGMLALKKEDADLIDFLNHVNTFSHVEPNLEKMTNNILTGIDKYEKDHHIDQNAIPPSEGTDIFISYSRGDSELVYYIYNRLKEKGLNVWFDRDSLEKGKDFMMQIENAIRNSTFFVPIFTPTILQQAHEEHPYRKEWLYAVDHIQNIGGISYCFPFFQLGFNMDDIRCNIPKDLKRHDAFPFTENTFDQDIDKLGDYLLNELKKRRNGNG